MPKYTIPIVAAILLAAPHLPMELAFVLSGLSAVVAIVLQWGER